MGNFGLVLSNLDAETFFGIIIEAGTGALGEIADKGGTIWGEIEHPGVGRLDVFDFFRGFVVF